MLYITNEGKVICGFSIFTQFLSICREMSKGRKISLAKLDVAFYAVDVLTEEIVADRFDKSYTILFTDTG